MLTVGLGALMLLGLSSCPRPIDEILVRAVEDALDPSVVILSPTANEIHNSFVRIEGTVVDDSLKPGDRQGLIQSIAFDVANDDFRRGKIDINSSGTATLDPSSGTGLTSWSWDNADGLFSFEFSTITPDLFNGPLVITVEAADLNGNVTAKQVTLLERQGPQLILEEPGTTVFTYEEGITQISITGTVGNSPDITDSTSEVSYLSWSVLGKPWGAALDLSAGSADWDAARQLYVTTNQGLLNPQEFTLDPNNVVLDPLSNEPVGLPFNTGFYVPYGAGTQLPIIVTARDHNGHIRTVSFVLYSDVSGPQVDIDTPDPSVTTYYSPNPGAFTPQQVTGFVHTDDAPSVAAMSYQVVASGFTPPGVSLNVATVLNKTTGAFSFALNHPRVDLTGVPGPVTVTVTFVDDRNHESRPSFRLYADSTAPTVVLSDNQADSILRDADTVLITATFSEANGIDETTPPTITIGSLPAKQDRPMSRSSNLVWTYSWNVPSGNDGPVSVSVSAADAAGNPNAAATGKTSYTIDNTDPLFAAVDPLVMAGDNSYADVTFSEGVYGDSGHSTAVVDGDLDLRMGTGATGVIDSWTISPAHTPGSDTLRIAITWSTAPETDDVIIVEPKANNRIFDTAGNDMPDTAAGRGTAKSLSSGVPYFVSVQIVQPGSRQSPTVQKSWIPPVFGSSPVFRQEEQAETAIELVQPAFATRPRAEPSQRTVQPTGRAALDARYILGFQDYAQPEPQALVLSDQQSIKSTLRDLELETGLQRAPYEPDHEAVPVNISQRRGEGTVITVPADDEGPPLPPLWVLALFVVVGTTALAGAFKLFTTVSKGRNSR